MIYEIDHPHVELLDWQKFQERPPPLIDKVIDRNEIEFPGWFVPLARGAAIASDALLREAGYRSGMRRPRGWRKVERHIFAQNIIPQFLLVHSKQDLWTIERWSLSRPYQHSDEILVHQFGSTPITTRDYQSAMRLAEHCHVKGPPARLRWINACPDDRDGAIEFARNRHICESLARPDAQ
jgi:hypothetical protein